MNSLIVLVVGLLAVGCGKTGQPLEPSQLSAEPSPANSPPKPTDQNTTKAEPVKELTLEESVLGEYEWRKFKDGDTLKQVLLENGIYEEYYNDKKRGDSDSKWSISKGEIHVKYDFGLILVYRINKDKSITQIAYIEDGKRTDRPKEKQNTWKKIK